MPIDEYENQGSSEPNGNPFVAPALPMQGELLSGPGTENDPPRRWNWFLVAVSWIVILSVCFFLCYTVVVSKAEERNNEDTKVDLTQANMAAKTVVGINELTKMAKVEQTSSPRTFDSGPLEQRYCQAIVINEMQGPDEALEYLEGIESRATKLDIELSPDQRDINRSLQNLFADYEEGSWDGPSLTAAEKQKLEDNLGWSGSLAVVPALGPNALKRKDVINESTNLAFAMIFAFAGMIFAAGGGFIAAIYATVMIFMGKVKSGISDQRRNGGIYIETFAVWMLTFLGMQFVLYFLRSQFGLPDAIVPVGFMLTLSALFWPIIRGVKPRAMLDDLGLRLKNPVKEMFCGMFAYLVTVPFMGAAMIVVAILVGLSAGMEGGHEFSAPPNPSHPVQEEIAGSGSWMTILLVIVNACIVAPIMEEIVFRGLLFRHKRELTRYWGWALSVAFSCLFNGLLFAMIHPQGLLAIPGLATLAIAFCLAREWRGSLIAPMTMHAINNGLITCLLLFML